MKCFNCGKAKWKRIEGSTIVVCTKCGYIFVSGASHVKEGEWAE